MIKVVRGNPTPEELAAALAVVRVQAAAALVARDGSSGRLPDAWSHPSRVARHRTPTPGPSSWTRTYWPS
ncbi:acyl-CoA carboxylase epsilon subunit [Streptomyces uncialis]|uniref:acyl-CoA carboxylase epsilon subunit n=1 Tax=Streptomyces uncialis TaxID=1048205 RepID=UPI00382C2339